MKLPSIYSAVCILICIILPNINIMYNLFHGTSVARWKSLTAPQLHPRPLPGTDRLFGQSAGTGVGIAAVPVKLPVGQWYHRTVNKCMVLMLGTRVSF